MSRACLNSLLAAIAMPVFSQPTLLSPPPRPCEPVNPNATAEARRLLKTICAVSGKFILSGQHNFPNHLSRHNDAVAAGAGKYPCIWGSDFGFTGGDDRDSILGREAMIEEAGKQFAAGHLKKLQEANIPVIWRPYHENNGTWFWWGGRP
jgi:mannan endo-1,4-beta-mannosidase